MFADSTTNTALCRWSLLFVFLSSSVQIPLDGCPEIHMHHPSHLRMKPQPLENNVRLIGLVSIFRSPLAQTWIR